MTVTLDATTVMWLTIGHINLLGDEVCCPTCCGPCWALKHLLDSGQIHDIVRPAAAGHDWWDDATGRVDAAWLASRWKLTDCHNTEGA